MAGAPMVVVYGAQQPFFSAGTYCMNDVIGLPVITKKKTPRSRT